MGSNDRKVPREAAVNRSATKSLHSARVDSEMLTEKEILVMAELSNGSTDRTQANPSGSLIVNESWGQLFPPLITDQ